MITLAGFYPFKLFAHDIWCLIQTKLIHIDFTSHFEMLCSHGSKCGPDRGGGAKCPMTPDT